MFVPIFTSGLSQSQSVVSVKPSAQGCALDPDETAALSSVQSRASMLKPSQITLNKQLAAYSCQGLPNQHAATLHALLHEQAREPLIVWRCGEYRILLTGYDRFPDLLREDVAVAVVEVDFASRAVALQFVL